MLALSYYLLKVIICSAILFGYYWLALRNKIFHQYNRFYLLTAIALSLLLPVTKIHFWETDAAEKPGVIKVLQAVSEGDVYLDNIIVTNQTTNWSPADWGSAAYFVISIAMLLILFHTLVTIFRLLKKYPRQQIGDISFINTDAKSTPFSFFNYIFWNNSIDTESATGKQIFKHEVAHIQQKHTYDKLFINAVLTFFWCNPFFWIIRKELNMIHEFIADKKAVEDSDTAAFAAMILQAAYPQHQFQIANNFFYSPIKRRLAMLVKNKNPKVNYWSRLLVLPVAVLLFAAFTFKEKKVNTLIATNIIADNGSANLLNNKIPSVLNDTIKKQKKQILKTSINNNACVIVADSFFLETTGKAPFGDECKPLMIINGTEFNYDQHQNIKITARVVKAHSKDDAAAIKKFGSKAKDGVLEFFNAIVETPLIIFPKAIPDVTVNNALIIVDNKELGTGQAAIDEINENDIDHMNVLKSDNAISKYGNKGKNGVIEIYTKKQTLPASLYVVDGEIRDNEYVNTINPENIQSIDVLKGESATVLYGEKGKDGVVKITTKFLPLHYDTIRKLEKPAPLYVIDGDIKGSKYKFNKINPNDIESINTLKGEKAVTRYGEAGKNGVIEITTKKVKNQLNEVVVNEHLSTKALTKTGVIYIGVINKILMPADKTKYDIMVNITNGSINGTDDYYTASVYSTASLLRITVLKKGSNQILYNINLKAVRIPDGMHEIPSSIKLDDYLKEEMFL